jgi:predicted nucleotidyltransferase
MSSKKDILAMKFHLYLEQVLGSKACISILRAMVRYKGKIFTVRGLAETANVSRSETAVLVEQLEKYGIVNIQPVGKSYQLSLNENSYILNKIIKPILRAEEKTLEELIYILKKHLNNKHIISAAIFGSIAKGEEKVDSDIDLLVISDHFDIATGLVSEAQQAVSPIFHSTVSPLIFSKKKFLANKNERLVRSILDSYIMITGRDLQEVTRKHD